jgi:RNA polymerase sigma-70 factor (ECF subfamily)
MASVVTRAGTLEVDDARNGLVERRVRQVVGAHYDFVWRSLRRLGVPEASADDAAQQVFCVFARRVRDVPADNDRTFLFGVAMRVAQSARRDRGRRPEVNDDDAVAAIASEQAAPDELVDERRARELLDKLLAELPIDLRTVFVLYELEELTMIEIARVLDLPSGTVASRLRRARELFEELSIRAREGSLR